MTSDAADAFAGSDVAAVAVVVVDGEDVHEDVAVGATTASGVAVVALVVGADVDAGGDDAGAGADVDVDADVVAVEETKDVDVGGETGAVADAGASDVASTSASVAFDSVAAECYYLTYAAVDHRMN